MDLLCKDLLQTWLNHHCAKRQFSAKPFASVFHSISHLSTTPFLIFRHLMILTSCFHCLYSSTASFPLSPHEPDVHPAGQIFAACYSLTIAIEWLLSEHPVPRWGQRWGNSNGTVVMIGFTVIKPQWKHWIIPFIDFCKNKNGKTILQIMMLL